MFIDDLLLVCIFLQTQVPGDSRGLACLHSHP